MRHAYDVISTERVWAGRIIKVRVDQVAMPGGRIGQRDVVEHPGAVGVVVLDPTDRVLLIRQYRHSIAEVIWEIPAGIRDVAGEDLVHTAQRELLEEAGLRAATWHVLCDGLSSPGMSDESYRVFLAREPSEVPAADRPELTDEELDLDPTWVDLDEACAWVLAGTIRNSMCGLGVLAAARARDVGFRGLREI
ncbi:MAG TPA: NUDIX hydrolase [Mycobacteriales bacterium]|nr:NUDIX hydrolase [Mycobacteriales bacterium]